MKLFKCQYEGGRDGEGEKESAREDDNDEVKNK